MQIEDSFVYDLAVKVVAGLLFCLAAVFGFISKSVFSRLNTLDKKIDQHKRDTDELVREIDKEIGSRLLHIAKEAQKAHSDLRSDMNSQFLQVSAHIQELQRLILSDKK